ncbi:ankyrin repeat domain-containing protein [bacterium]|jgi:hypothetical protein|nr:ankyrin repeat domain-containing protein [bacterium]
MKIPCSNCNQRLEIPEELAGQAIECPACNASLAVPTMVAPAPAPVQESAPQAATSKKSILSIPKWAIASIAGIAVVVVGLIMFSPDTAVKTDGESQQPAPVPEAKPIKPVAGAKAPNIDIHLAIKFGNIEAVKQHLAAGTGVNAIGGFRKASPLYMAAYSYNAEATKLLLENGADVHQLDFKKETALHTAAYHSYHGEGDVSVVALLVDHGSKINAISDLGQTPLDLAIIAGTPEVSDLLRKHGGKMWKELEAAGK